tara:strand:- start:19 stop:2079 length:2061 start_codon:yes stop_codon:yes gene_type:complete
MADKKDLNKYADVVVTAEDFPAPRGRNGMSAFAIFSQREYYNEGIYPREFDAPIPFDLWDGRPFFGKVNLKGEPIFAPTTFLKQVENNVWLLDFVADAFNDFKTEFLFLNKNNVEGTPYALLTPTRGWSSALNLYDDYMDRVYDSFIAFIETSDTINHLLDFSEFMEVFYHFVADTSPAIPVTFGQFVMSKHCPPTTSGLMVDLSTNSHGNDADKFNNFLNDNSFICFAETAERFGFKIDKNYPGRLIADINSPVMKRDGDATKTPSEGGMGYMLRYPQQPKNPKNLYQNPPPPPEREIITPPTEVPSNPFEVGDIISLATVRSERSTPGFTYTILKDHTSLSHRQREPGHRPRKYKGKNVLNFLKDKTLQTSINGLLVPLYGELITLSSHSNFQEKAREFFGPTYEPPEEEVAIIDLKAMVGTMGTSPAGVWMGNDEKILGVSADSEVETAISDTREYNFTTQFWSDHMYVEVPMSALHLKDGATPFTIQRYTERLNYDTRLQKYINQQDAADKKYANLLKEYDDRVLPGWNDSRMQNEKEWNNYENPNARLTISNLFTRRFGSANLASVELLKQLCMQFYYSYVQVNPNAVITHVDHCGPNDYKTRTRITKRQLINKKLINEKYPDSFWIKQYILICNAQSENKYSLNKLRSIRKRAIEIYNKKGIKESLAYVEGQMPSTKFKK